MPRACSTDLRAWLVDAVDGGQMGAAQARDRQHRSQADARSSAGQAFAAHTSAAAAGW